MANPRYPCYIAYATRINKRGKAIAHFQSKEAGIEFIWHVHRTYLLPDLRLSLRYWSGRRYTWNAYYLGINRLFDPDKVYYGAWEDWIAPNERYPEEITLDDDENEIDIHLDEDEDEL